MTKQEFVRANKVEQMPKLVQVLVGRLWDAAQAEGETVGYRKGVDAVTKKQEEIYKRMYDEGARDATHRGSAAFSAAVCKVLHQDFRFGAQRCKRVVDGIAEELIGMLDPAETIRELREWGVKIEWDDEFWEEAEV